MPKPIKKEILKALKEYQQRVADILTKQGIKAHVVGDLKAYKKLAPIRIDFSSVQKGAKEFGVQYGDLLRKEGATMIHGKKVAWLAESMKDTRSKVSDIITEGVRTGKGTDAIARELRGTLIRDKNYEYKRIARTETGNIQAEAADKRYKEEGVEEVDWLCGQKPCSMCAQYCGKRYKIGEAPDLLVHPNCTCDKAPVVTKKVRAKIDKKDIGAIKIDNLTIKTDSGGMMHKLEPFAMNRRDLATSKLKVSDKQFAVADLYKSTKYGKINNALRGTDDMTLEVKAYIKHMDAGLKKSIVPEDITVYRSFGMDQAEILKRSKTFTDKAYLSTTYTPQKTTMFGGRGEDGFFNIMQIKVKKGSKAFMYAGYEDELTLPRGMNMKCTAIKEVKKIIYDSGNKKPTSHSNVRIFVMEEVSRKKKVVVPLKPKVKAKDDPYYDLKRDERGTADELWKETKKDGKEHLKLTNSEIRFVTGDMESVHYRIPRTSFDARHTHPDWDSPLSGVDLSNFLGTENMRSTGASSPKRVYVALKQYETKRFLADDKKRLAAEFKDIASKINNSVTVKLILKTEKKPTQAQASKIWHDALDEANKVFAKKYKYTYISFGRTG